MARYRKIDVRIWNDATFGAFSDDAKLAFLFLLTHPNLTSLGAMRHTKAGLAEELRWSLARFTRTFQALTDARRVQFDPASSLLWLPNFLRYNKPEAPNVVKAWSSAVDLLPECPLREQAIATAEAITKGMGEAFHEAFREGFHKAFRKTMPNQEQEQEQEQYQEQEHTHAARVAGVSVTHGHSPAQRRSMAPWESAIGIDVNQKLHREFAAKLTNVGEPNADAVLLAWYAETEKSHHGVEIGEDAYDFWRKRFAEWRGVTPKAKPADDYWSTVDYTPSKFKTGGAA
jgi:hypothetical protein